MNLQDFSDILKHLPPHILQLIGMLFVFSLYWKKSSWPNKYYGSINLLLGMVAYTLLETGLSDEPFKLYRQPYFILPIYGLGAAIVAWVGHSLIIVWLKKKYPSIEWPDDEPKVGAQICAKPSPIVSDATLTAPAPKP
jgi:hypothetical protein